MPLHLMEVPCTQKYYQQPFSALVLPLQPSFCKGEETFCTCTSNGVPGKPQAQEHPWTTAGHCSFLAATSLPQSILS